jgi:hypothetical protein
MIQFVVLWLCHRERGSPDPQQLRIGGRAAGRETRAPLSGEPILLALSRRGRSFSEGEGVRELPGSIFG